MRVIKDGRSIYTGEIHFTDELTDEVSKVEPYNGRINEEGRVRNMEDKEFVDGHGTEMIMNPSGDMQTGLEGSMDIVVDSNIHAAG
jgi:hypothetical protein